MSNAFFDGLGMPKPDIDRIIVRGGGRALPKLDQPLFKGLRNFREKAGNEVGFIGSHYNSPAPNP